MKKQISFILCGVLIVCVFAPTAIAKNMFHWRQVHYRARMFNTNDVDEMLETMDRAAKAGYNAFVHEPRMVLPANLAKAAEKGMNRVLSKAKALKLALIPYSWKQQDAVEVDTMLAEGLPVKGTPFKVNGNVAKVIPSSTGVPKEPALWQKTPACVVDHAVKHSGSSSLRITNPPKHTEFTASATLKPFRAYEISVWIKTDEYTGYLEPEVRVKAGNRWLLKRYDRTFMTPKSWSHIGKTMNWKRCRIDFNSLEATRVTIGIYTGRRAYTGSIWFDNIDVREVGLYETLRGEDKPIVVRSADGKKTYVEGKDYVVDPKCNKFTANSFDYEGSLTIPAGSAIQNGEELAVDWCQFGNVEKLLPASDYSSSKSWEMVEKISKEIQTAYDNPPASFIAVNEWREAFWNTTAQSQFKTASEYMANAVKRKMQILQGINPGQKVFTWSDMFDPYHNSRNPFWMVKGGTYRTWEYIPKSIIIINWNAHQRKNGMHFWAGFDPDYPKVFQSQIFSINEGGTEKWLEELSRMEATGKLRDDAVVGLQYTTWYHNYSPLERVAEICKKAGRWGTNSFISHDAKSSPASPVRLALQVGGSGHVAYCLPAGTMEAKLELYNMAGKKVAAETISNMRSTHLTLCTSKLGAGVYAMRLRALDRTGQSRTATAQMVHFQ